MSDNVNNQDIPDDPANYQWNWCGCCSNLPNVPPYFTQRIPNIVPGYSEFELINGLNRALMLEQEARNNTDLELKGQIEQEVKDRTAADANLQNQINEQNTALEAEIAARQTADTQLQNNINQEVKDRTAADANLQNQINEQKTALDAEITARQAADTQLQNNINAEALARKNADTAINASIEELENEVVPMQADIALLKQGLADEKSERQEDTETLTAELENCVKYTPQTLTDEQKAQARANIGAGSGGGSTDGAVLYVQAQNLTDEQKHQARENIGAGTTQNAILYDTLQTAITTDQQIVACENAGAVPYVGNVNLQSAQKVFARNNIQAIGANEIGHTLNWYTLGSATDNYGNTLNFSNCKAITDSASGINLAGGKIILTFKDVNATTIITPALSTLYDYARYSLTNREAVGHSGRFNYLYGQGGNQKLGIMILTFQLQFGGAVPPGQDALLPYYWTGVVVESDLTSLPVGTITRLDNTIKPNYSDTPVGFSGSPLTLYL